MTFLSDYPTIDEWLAAIRANPEAADEHATYLKRQAAGYGPYAPPYLADSILFYENALVRSATLLQDIGASSPSTEYPDEQTWQALIRTDAQAAKRQLFVLQKIAAAWGPFDTPYSVRASLDAYEAAERAVQAAND